MSVAEVPSMERLRDLWGKNALGPERFGFELSSVRESREACQCERAVTVITSRRVNVSNMNQAARWHLSESMPHVDANQNSAFCTCAGIVRKEDLRA